MSLNFEKIAENVVHQARKNGADQAEAYIINAKELTIDVSGGEVETLKLAEDRGLGIRVFREGRIGFSYTSDLNDSAVAQMVLQALGNSENTSPDEFNRLPEKKREYAKLDLFDAEIESVSENQKIEIAKNIEAQAKAYDKRITITEKSSYFDSQYEIYIANSLGINAGYTGSYCGCYADLVAEENGDSQTGFAINMALKFKNLNPDKIGIEAAEKAVRKLGAASIGTQKAVVVFDPYVATNFLGVISPALSAEAVQKGRSLFAGKIGQAVASSVITVIDDGAMEGGISSAPFDGEGVPTGRTTLIENGQLKGFLHNTYTAAKEGVQSTGNGVRGSFKSNPEVGTTNFFIMPGKTSPDELISDITNGFYVTDVMGMHTANPISGDFSVGAGGILIENGKMTKAVRGVAIAGNILDLLSEIEGVGNDLTFFGGKGAPTLRISKMTISGS